MLQTGEYYNPDLVVTDNENLLEFYRSLGYLNASSKETLISIKENRISLIFRMIEADQVRVKSIEFFGNKVLSAEKIMAEIPIKKNNPYNEIDIINSKVKILELYHKQGYLDAAITINKEISGTDSSIAFSIREGTKSLFGKTVIIGNSDTKREVFSRVLLHKEDEPFNDSSLLKERQRLYRTGLFTGIEITPRVQAGNNRDVLYRVEEGEAGAFEFGGGYGEYERIRGFFDASYKNLFGMNREIAFRTEMSTLNRRFLLTYFEPWFLNQDLGFKVQLLKEYRKEINIDTHDTTYRLDRYAVIAGIEKKLDDRIKAEAYYELSRTNTYDVKPDIILTHEDSGTLLISAIKLGLIYDSRDNPFEPRSGYLVGLTYKIAAGILLSESEFHKVQMYLNRYIALSKDIVLAASLRGGYARSFDKTSSLPLVERFFLGGRTTVRGYDQDMLGPKGSDNNPTGGNVFAMENLELRFNVWKGLGLVTFLDGGNVWQKAGEFSFGSIKYTTGIGLRYNTPVGPIRVDFGYKLNRERGENIGAVHFSVGHAF
jgi:outer membrane protein insertion porin family